MKILIYRVWTAGCCDSISCGAQPMIIYTVRSLGIEDHSSVKLPGIFNMIRIVFSDEKGPQLVSIHSE